MAACAEPAPPKPAQPTPSIAAAPSMQPEQAAKPAFRTGNLAVAIVIDQFAAWIARERLPLLPASGGFARLLKEGTWYRDVRFAHAITETAAGHASLYTGKVPHEHGIVANDVRVGDESVGILVDPSTYVVSATGVGTEVGSSAAAVQSELVADRLRANQPQAKIYSFSLKDRGAIVGGGHHPDLTLWYDPKQAQFVTSTAFANRLPDWAIATAGPAAVAKSLDQIWLLLDESWVSAHALTKDEQAGEGDYEGYGIVFPHRARNSKKPLIVFRDHPISDRVLLDLGLQALDHSPSDSSVLLAISLSANDYIGHFFGPDSWEAWDELRRLDAALAGFFAELDRRQGSEHWSLVLSSDHGVLPLPEVNRELAASDGGRNASSLRPREVGGRLLPLDLEKAARGPAQEALGKGEWIAAVVDPYLYYSDAARRLAPHKLAQLHRVVTEALSKVPGVNRLFDVATQPEDCPPYQDDSFEALVCRSIRKGSGGDVFISLKPGYFFDTGYVPGYGTSHGNAAIYDRSVPVLVRAPGRVQAGKVEDSVQSFVLYSQQLERLVGLP